MARSRGEPVAIVNQHQEAVSSLIRRVENGDSHAEHHLWNEFFEKLLRHLEGRVRRRGVPTGLIDEEAVAVSALESVFKCARQGRLQSVRDWTELSQLLFAMTNRKFVDHWRRATKKASYPGEPPKELTMEAGIVAKGEIPETTVTFDEQLSCLLEMLPDELHRQIAVLKLAGYSLTEISEQVSRAVPTVNRKWRSIRGIWADELKRSG